MSFVPCNLSRVNCDKEHAILGNTLTVFCFSDQNFVSSLAAENGRCLNIVCLENASLLELLELAKEVICNVKLPEGSCLLCTFYVASS